jgi:hypothetical protein
MRRAAIVLLAWGAWLGALTAVQLAFAGVRPHSVGLHPIEYWMLGGASGACLVTGLVLWRLDARGGPRRTRGAPRLVFDDSVASATIACGLALALLGAGFGLWLILIGAGVIALGLGGLVREARARRRVRRRLGDAG